MDYEKHPSEFKFHIAAYDQGPTPLFQTVPVTINLTNTNDRMPYFTKNNYLQALFLPVYNGTFLLQLTAHDGDMGNKDILKYSLLSGADWFNINPITGNLNSIILFYSL